MASDALSFRQTGLLGVLGYGLRVYEVSWAGGVGGWSSRWSPRPVAQGMSLCPPWLFGFLARQ